MTISPASIKISDDEHRARSHQLLEHIQSHNLSGVVLFDNTYILYYSGFAFVPTERPMAFAMSSKGQNALFVPRLELEHAEANALIDRVASYPEYPSDSHPMQALDDLLSEMGISGAIAADDDGYPWIFGYRGDSLTAMGYDVRPLRAIIEDQLMIKSDAELRLIEESCRWGNLAHMLLQRYTKVGLTETEVSRRASTEATLTMLDSIGPIYRAQSPFSNGASAGYRGQIGRNAAIPHALAANLTFQAGDVRAYFDKHELWDYWKHHVGHAIGLRYHEGPFLDIGDQTIMQPGMVFTVEPDLYVDGLGGFRHSDTVAITEEGLEFMTYYPRDLESLTLPL